MRSNYFDTVKYKIFPEIEDFTDPQNHLRNMDTRKMSWTDWLFFHPSAYTLYKLGTHGTAIFFFLIGLIWGIVIKNDIFTLLFLVMICIQAYAFYKRIKQYPKLIKGKNFYDEFFREYSVDDKLKEDFK